jgi:hypothetical protein
MQKDYRDQVGGLGCLYDRSSTYLGAPEIVRP